MGTDKDWEQWGATYPYFGVLSSDRFRKHRLDESVKKEFFATALVEKLNKASPNIRTCHAIAHL